MSGKYNEQEILRLYNEGYNQTQIANLIKCCIATVSYILRKYGLGSHQRTPLQRLEQRLKVNEKTDCWEFQGAKLKGKDGHGYIRLNSVNILAHRLAYSLFVGEIPEGLWVLHKCDNPPYCNPDHLFLGDCADNVRDMHNKNRSAKAINESKKAKIKELRSQGLSPNLIAEKLNISRSSVYKHG